MFEELKELDINSFWGGITDPRLHDSSRYRYLITAINPNAAFGAMFRSLIEPGVRSSIDEGNQAISLYAIPERLNDRVANSCSLVDQNHPQMWGSAGLILGVDPTSVLISYPRDRGVLYNNLQALKRQAAHLLFYEPDQLISATSPREYNEVVILGKTASSPSHVIGTFGQVGEDGEELIPFMCRRMQDHAQRLHVPYVELVFPSPYKENIITVEGGKLTSVCLNKWHYNLESFHSTKYGISVSFMSPQEFELVAGYLVENQHNIEDLRIRYQHALDEYQAPNLGRMDVKGPFTYITQKQGFGDDARIVYIYPNRVAAFFKLQSEITQYMIEESLEVVSKLPTETPIPNSEARSIIQAAIDRYPDHADELRVWLASFQ